ncbi:MAG: hypothetical protein ACK5BL_12600, partial [Flavobacteriales bacterium]
PLQRMFSVVETDLNGIVYLLLEVGGGLTDCESSGADEKGNKNVFHKWILGSAKIEQLNPFENEFVI